MLSNIKYKIDGQRCCFSDDDAPKLPKNNILNFYMLRKRVAARAESRAADRRSSIMKHTETAKLLDERSVSIPSESKDLLNTMVSCT